MNETSTSQNATEEGVYRFMQGEHEHVFRDRGGKWTSTISFENDNHQFLGVTVEVRPEGVRLGLEAFGYLAAENAEDLDTLYEALQDVLTAGDRVHEDKYDPKPVKNE
jgi:hypothetical protein